MVPSKAPINLLLVGDNQARVKLLTEVLKQKMPHARTAICSSLRVGSPDAPLPNLSALVLLWENNPMNDWRQILTAPPPSRRSFEGIVWKLANASGEKILRRTAILSDRLAQEEVFFLAEFNIRTVKTLSSERKNWGSEVGVFVDKLKKLISDEESGGGTPFDRAVRRFELALERWSKLDGFQRMHACDYLRLHIGNSATYDELMARKALAENNTAKAEQLLRQSLEKNPNYVASQEALAELYMNRGQVGAALDIYLAAHRRNSRHPGRAARIAECYLKLGRIEEADNAYSNLLQLDQYADKARESFARTRIAMGDYHSAKTLIQGTDNAHGIASSLNAIGIQLVKENRFSEAIEHYKNAQFVMPTNAFRHLLFLNIGIAYAKWGKAAEARQYAQLAIAREPNCQKAFQLLKSLEGTNPLQASTNQHSAKN